MNYFTKLICAFALVIFISFISFSQTEKQISEIISSTQTKFVPDKRVGIFNIEHKLNQGKVLINGETDNKDALESLVSELGKIKGVSVNNKVVLLPESSLGDKTTGIIRVSVAHMRKGPDEDQEMVSQAILGMKVKILKKKDGYYLSQTPDNYLGWIETGSMQTGNKEFIDEWDKSKRVVFIDQFGLIYSEPNDNSNPVGDYVFAAVIKSEGTENGWMKVKTLKDETGYVKEKSVMDFDEWTKTRKPTAENIINTAKKFLGFPYQWGGYSAKGLDCSGFVKTSFWFNGILLPRDANQQGMVGEEVNPGKDFENVNPGDLVFFGPTKNGKSRITHVGLYIGNKSFIHSSTFVQISSFDKESKYYDRYHCEHLLKVMRILK